MNKCDLAELEEDVYREWLDNSLKDAHHYLVYAQNARWDGASAYKLTDDKYSVLYRDYDVKQYFEDSSKGLKVMHIAEASHDVPLGYKVTIIALTDKEYDKLENAAFDTIKKFVSKFQNKAQNY